MIKDLDIESVMSTQNGRAFVYWVLSTSGLYRSSFVSGSEALTLAFNEGMRNMGLITLAEVRRVCPDQYGLMLKEQGNDE